MMFINLLFYYLGRTQKI